MLKHPTEERLAALGLAGMAKALEEQRKQPDIAALAFEERFALLVDRDDPKPRLIGVRGGVLPIDPDEAQRIVRIASGEVVGLVGPGAFPFEEEGFWVWH